MLMGQQKADFLGGPRGFFFTRNSLLHLDGMGGDGMVVSCLLITVRFVFI